MNLRPYQPDDFETLYKIEEICFTPACRFSRRLMRQLVRGANRATWMAEVDGALAGFIIVEWSREENLLAAYLHTLEVLPAERGLGLGKALLDAAEESARKAKADLVWLHVEEKNQAAIRLYERAGFHPVGREENYYPEKKAALVYLKRLAEVL